MLVSRVMVECSMFDIRLCFFYCEHEHCSEVLGFENYDFIVVFFALLMVCPLTKQVGFLVCYSWFVVKREVIFS